MRRALSFSRRSKTDAHVVAPPATPSKDESDARSAPPSAAEPSGQGAVRSLIKRTLSFNRGEHALPRNWERKVSSDGDIFFYNVLTGTSRSTRPAPLPKPWREAVEKATGKVYYWNPKTRAVRWEPPTGTDPRPSDNSFSSQSNGIAPPPPAPAGLQSPSTPLQPPMPPPPMPPTASPPTPEVPAVAKPPAREGVKVGQRVASFGRKPRKRGSGEGKSAEQGGPSVSEFAGRPKLNIADYMFSKRLGEVLIKKPGDINGQQFIIEECEDCDIFLLDWSATVTIDQCKRCRIFIGPCESSVFFRDCEEIKAVIACQQLRTREVHGIDAQLLTVSQPSVESSSRVRFGCFCFNYSGMLSHLKQALDVEAQGHHLLTLDKNMPSLQANLSPFNNRWSEPYNFTPHVGEVGFLPLGTHYTSLLSPLSQLDDTLLSSAEEANMASACPIPSPVGEKSASITGLEQGFVLVLPCQAHKALELVHLITRSESAACTLVRSREYAKVPPTFVKRLLETSTNRKQLSDAAMSGRLIGLQFAAKDCVATLSDRIREWNQEAGEVAAYTPSARTEVILMMDIFFENTDSGHALH